MTHKTRTPQEWQTNPDSIETEYVQFWHNGVMIASQYRKEDARNAVRVGRAFVISGQAIGAMINGQMAS